MHRVDSHFSITDFSGKERNKNDIRINLALALWQQVLFPHRIPLLWHYQSNFHVAWLHHLDTRFPEIDTSSFIATLFDLVSPAVIAQEPWKQLNAIHFDYPDDPDSQRRILDQLVREQYSPAQVMRVILEGTFEMKEIAPPKLLQKAADTGETEAFARLQSFYQLTEQKKEANGCERIAALLGHADSLVNIAHALRYRQRWEESFVYYYHAARQGHAGAIAWVAYCAAQGKGRSQDIETTIHWLLQLQYCQSVSDAPILPTRGWPVLPGTRIYMEDMLESMLDGYDRFVKDKFWHALDNAGLIPMIFSPSYMNTDTPHDTQTLVDIQLYTTLGADTFLKECTELCSAMEHVRYRQVGYEQIDHHIDRYSRELHTLLSGICDFDSPDDAILPDYNEPLIESTVALRDETARRLMRVLNTIDHFGKLCDAAWLQEKIDEKLKNALHNRAKYVVRYLINQLHQELRDRAAMRFAQ